MHEFRSSAVVAAAVAFAAVVQFPVSPDRP